MITADRKVYVPVQVDFDRTGYMMPKKLRWEDGRIFTIDEVVSARRAEESCEALPLTQYHVRIHGQDCHIFFENSRLPGDYCPGRWFVERRWPAE